MRWSPYEFSLHLLPGAQRLCTVVQMSGRILAEVRVLKGCSAWVAPASQEMLCSLSCRIHLPHFLTQLQDSLGLSAILASPQDRSQSQGSTGGFWLRVRPRTEHGFDRGAGGATTVPEESGSGRLRAGTVVPAHTSHRGKTE